jgi:hypothetical protein
VECTTSGNLSLNADSEGSPPTQFTDDVAHDMVEDFIAGR